DQVVYRTSPANHVGEKVWRLHPAATSAAHSASARRATALVRPAPPRRRGAAVAHKSAAEFADAGEFVDLLPVLRPGLPMTNDALGRPRRLAGSACLGAAGMRARLTSTITTTLCVLLVAGATGDGQNPVPVA